MKETKVKRVVVVAAVAAAAFGGAASAGTKAPSRDVVAGGGGSGFSDCNDQRIGWTYTAAGGKTWVCTWGSYGDYWA